MEQFNELLDELNFCDSSVGINPIDSVNEAIEVVEEYNFEIVNKSNEVFTIIYSGQKYDFLHENSKWTVTKQVKKADIDDTIEITGFYDEIAWYSEMLGRRFKVIEVNDCDVKVKLGNGKISYYVAHSDYKVI